MVSICSLRPVYTFLYIIINSNVIASFVQKKKIFEILWSKKKKIFNILFLFYFQYKHAIFDHVKLNYSRIM